MQNFGMNKKLVLRVAVPLTASKFTLMGISRTTQLLIAMQTLKVALISVVIFG